MGIYYNPPQPTQAQPHAPIGAQPSNPPVRTACVLPVFAVISLAWIPAPQQPQRNVPSLAWLQVQGFIPHTSKQPPQFFENWSIQSLAGSAAVQSPTATTQPVAPSQAPVYVWPQITWPAQTYPDNAAWNQPGKFVPSSRAQISWPQVTWGTQSLPRVPIPVQAGNPPRGLLAAPLALSWPQLTWPAQTYADNAAWNQPSAYQPYVAQQIAFSWPQPTWNTQVLAKAPIPAQPAKPVPRTLVAPFALNWPQVTWNAQRAIERTPPSGPVVIQPGGPSASPPAGGKHKRHRYVVRFNGQEIQARSLEDALQLLNQAKAYAREQQQLASREATEFHVEPELQVIEVQGSPELSAPILDARVSIDFYYESAKIDQEIARSLADYSTHLVRTLSQHDQDEEDILRLLM